MVKIKLARFGKKKQPVYRLVVSDVRKDTQGSYIECIGHYNPLVEPREFNIDVERAHYWLSHGAQPTAVIHNMFVDEGILHKPKKKTSRLLKTEQADQGVEADKQTITNQVAENKGTLSNETDNKEKSNTLSTAEPESVVESKSPH